METASAYLSIQSTFNYMWGDVRTIPKDYKDDYCPWADISLAKDTPQALSRQPSKGLLYGSTG